MTNYDKEIADKIKDGSYFTDAREWYMRQYLYPITERSFLIIVTVILVACCVFLVLNFTAIREHNSEMALPIKVDNSYDYFSVIKPIASYEETTQEAVARYLVNHYVTTREEYFPSEILTKEYKYRIKKMKSSSSKKVLNEYQNYMNSLNPYSPVSRYEDHTSREIAIKSFNFDGDDKTSGKVRVLFEATEIARENTDGTKMNSDDDAKIKKSLWEATVHFKLPDIETIARTGAPLRFIVKYYRARLVK